jgi:ABC-2 type transport system permease protein
MLKHLKFNPLSPMNFINAFLLSFFLKPVKFYEALGIDTVKLKSILTFKLIMDDRQPFGLGNWQQAKKEEPVSNATWLAIGIYALMGVMMMLIFILGASTLMQFTIFFAIFLVMATLAIVVDFSRVLIDVRDNYILLPKPINDRTFLASRILHITIHISKMVIPFSLPAAVVVLISYGIIGFLAFLLVLIFATLFSLLLINVTYLAILKFSKPEKFKSIINYLQIGITIAIFGGYQLIPRLISKSMLEQVDLSTVFWVNAIPPFWFAALWELIAKQSFHFNIVLGSLLAIVIPVMGIYLVIKVFAPSFNKKLSLITGSGEMKSTLTKEGKIKRALGDMISSVITTSGPEKMGFDFVWRMMLRSREFKMMVYPAIGYFIVLVVVFIIQGGGLNPDNFRLSNPGNNFGKLAMLYFPALLMMSAITTFHLTPLWKGSWIYEMSPTEHPGKIISGGIKAVIAQFMLIPFLLLGVFGFAINGWMFFPVLLMAISLQIMIAYIIHFTYPDYLPFSQPFVGSGGDAASVGKGFIALIILVLLGLVHWLVLDKWWLMLVISFVAMLVIWQLHRQVLQTPWKKIQLQVNLACYFIIGFQYLFGRSAIAYRCHTVHAAQLIIQLNRVVQYILPAFGFGLVQFIFNIGQLLRYGFCHFLYFLRTIFSQPAGVIGHLLFQVTNILQSLHGFAEFITGFYQKVELRFIFLTVRQDNSDRPTISVGTSAESLSTLIFAL